jgi:hypothetical protein
VVGNDIEDLSQIALAQFATHPLVAGKSAQFFVRLTVIDNVVAVHAARLGLQIGRRIHMRDAQRRQIVCHLDHSVETEPRVELQTVSRER